MILQLPPQCVDIILDSLGVSDLISLGSTCKELYELMMLKIYKQIYYLPGYSKDPVRPYRIISSRNQMLKFLLSDIVRYQRRKFEFQNLSDEKYLQIDGGEIIDLDQLSVSLRPDFDQELFVPFKVEDYPKNLDTDYLEIFKKSPPFTDLVTLSLVIKNSHSLQDNELILSKVDHTKIRNLELILIDDGGDLVIFKSLPALLSAFTTSLSSLSIIYMNLFEDNKNNLRVMMINSLVMTMLINQKHLNKMMIYLDIVNLQLVQLTLLQQQLSRFQFLDRLSFNCNLNNLEIDFVILKELNFFKNFISNSSIVVLLYEEFLKIDKVFQNLFRKLNSNFKMDKLDYKMDFKNLFLYSDFFLKSKLLTYLQDCELKSLTLFNINFVNQQTPLSKSCPCKVKITNICNYHDQLVERFDEDMTEINRIFT